MDEVLATCDDVGKAKLTQHQICMHMYKWYKANDKELPSKMQGRIIVDDLYLRYTCPDITVKKRSIIYLRIYRILRQIKQINILKKFLSLDIVEESTIRLFNFLKIFLFPYITRCQSRSKDPKKTLNTDSQKDTLRNLRKLDLPDSHLANQITCKPAH